MNVDLRLACWFHATYNIFSVIFSFLSPSYSSVEIGVAIDGKDCDRYDDSLFNFTTILA